MCIMSVTMDYLKGMTVGWDTPGIHREINDLLRASKNLDFATGQPDCELESKKAEILELARKQWG